MPIPREELPSLRRKRIMRVALGILGAVLLVAAAGVIVKGYSDPGWRWVGIAAFTKPPSDYQPAKMLWDWLQLLIIPVVLAVAGYWYNTQQKQREAETSQDKQREDLLATYFDRLSDLLLKGELSPPAEDAEGQGQAKGKGSAVARARTLTVLRRLDGDRRGSLVRFLSESGLITAKILPEDPAIMTAHEPLKGQPILSLSDADLFGADLRWADLRGADLRGADLRGANLRGADLRGADLRRADLQNANLDGANLRWANLQDTDLRWADLRWADLGEADLHGAHAYFARLQGADFRGANLQGADLYRASYGTLTHWPVPDFNPDETGAIERD